MALAIYGIGITRSTAIGRVHIARRNHFDVAEQTIDASAIDQEIQRFRKAIRQAREELVGLRERVAGSVQAEIIEFIDTHRMMLEDSTLTEAPVQLIREGSCSAEWALQVQRNRLAAVFEGMDDPYLASRVDDVDQCVARVQRMLAQSGSHSEENESQSYSGLVVVADDIAPADLTMMHHEGICGLVTEHGGPLSHTAILARSLKIPAAMGVHHARTLLREGERVIIDGERGIVIAEPPRSVQHHYRNRIKRAAERVRLLERSRHRPALSRDGETITLQANVDIPGDLALLKDSGADGVGLYRSEYLFMNRSEPPDEEEQLEAYAKVIQAMDGKPVTLRTLDLGADKQVDGGRASGPVPVNPALGLRAIRLCLSEPDLFVTQLRAMLRASVHGPIRILIPMLSNSQELFRVRGMVREVTRDLRREGQTLGDQIQLGGMIEVPAAALAARTFAKHLDFLSIGTNDLIQYTLAIDRIDDQVSYLYDPLHPSVLRLLNIIISEAAEVNTPVSMCGEMAGDHTMTRLLLCLGLRDFSMHPGSLLEVKHVVTETDLSRLKPIARRLLNATNPLRIQAMLRELNAIDG